MREWTRRDLSQSIKRAIVVILEDGLVIKQTEYWSGKSGRKIFWHTIDALYDRFLIKIVVESRHRRRHTAMLTNIGQYAAREIKRELDGAEKTSNGALGISEEAAEFIATVTA